MVHMPGDTIVICQQLSKSLCMYFYIQDIRRRYPNPPGMPYKYHRTTLEKWH